MTVSDHLIVHGSKLSAARLSAARLGSADCGILTVA